MIPAAVYLRVSTDRQTVENQRADLARMCEARGLAPTFYEETESGAAKSRPVLERVMADARAGKVRVVLVWALDRLDRNMHACITRVLELDRLNVQLVSMREPWLDTGGPVRSLLVSIFGWVAEQERARLIERTRAGLERARREGKKLGRPRVSSLLLAAAARRVLDGESLREAAKRIGVSKSVLARHIAALRADEGGAGTVADAPLSQNGHEPPAGPRNQKSGV